ncbi:MAG: hypothetical protein A49_23850 [Methyloceanibacter sp.]|nr:MAG: hypothetical protein A49_23850 [Methyloceanibacter sp.]
MMTTMTKSRARRELSARESPTAGPPPTVGDFTVQALPLDQLVRAADNRREPPSDASLRSLAQSIKLNGVLQPIIVRPHPTEAERFEIRAGERRWRASHLAGLTTIPAIVRSLDDEAALTITLIENLQRENLHPLEEAATIELALEGGFDLKAFASRLGRTVPYLVRRASLNRLTEAWQQAIRRRDSDASRLSAAHLELIARLPAATQNRLAERDGAEVFDRGFPTVDELRRLIDADLQSLAAMPWKLDDETLEPAAGACTECAQRSSRQPLLFPELGRSRAEGDDRCLDSGCYLKKQIAYLERCEARLRAKHPTLQLVELGVGEVPPRVREAFTGRLVSVYYPHVVKASDDGAQPVMPVNGPKLGKLVHLDLGGRSGRGRNGRHQRPRDENGKVVPLSIDERRARLQKRRDVFVVNAVRTRLEAVTPEEARGLAAAAGKKRPAAHHGASLDGLSLLVAFGSLLRADSIVVSDCWDRYDELLHNPGADRAAAALCAVIPVWIKRLSGAATDFVTVQIKDAQRICDLLGMDYAAQVAEAVKSIPEPKSWAREAQPGSHESPISPDPASTCPTPT